MNDKRSQIFEVSFLPVTNASIINVPGKENILVRGAWTPLHISSGEWKETVKVVGESVDQELKATVPDTSPENENRLRRLLTCEGLVLLKLTNGDEKVAGSEEFPVIVSIERSGDPGKIILSFKRSSPEPAKKLTSF